MSFLIFNLKSAWFFVIYKVRALVGEELPGVSTTNKIVMIIIIIINIIIIIVIIVCTFLWNK